jgi:squalene-hopene/tetraprenyl-beta-curcumene cyclase
MTSRRKFLTGCIELTASTILGRFVQANEDSTLAERIHTAISSAVEYLTQRQSSDGAWRSEIYGPFKDGPSLTSLVAATFTSLERTNGVESAELKAAEYLAATIGPGTDSLTYPVYTAAGAVISLKQRHQFIKERNAWLNYLRSLQLTEDLGWHPSDLAYGGWGYAASGLQPLHGAPATPLAVPNLSATVFALEALRAAGVSCNDPAIRRAQLFVERCQNWSDNSGSCDDAFNDGGFHFLLEDPQRNKAGEVGIDSTGRCRFASYGSATADGLRALAHCGLKKDDPRRLAAEHWLLRNFSAEQHPGGYQPQREHLRPTLYYYYAASFGQVLRFSDDSRSCANEMAATILERQRSDGSWSNAAVDVREDDPLVATPLAIQSLQSRFAT